MGWEATSGTLVAQTKDRARDFVTINKVRNRERFGSLEAVGSIAQCFPEELLISKRKLRQADAVQLVRLKRESATQNIGFASRPFVLCGLPIKRPPKGVLMHERRNGINRHGVEDGRALRERSSEPPGPEFCGGRREAASEA